MASKTLRDELKMTKPFKSVEEEALLSIARTAALIEHAGAEAFKPFNLTITQYNVLRILRGAGTEGLCRNEVGERLVTKVPDVTRLLDRMEAAGLIVRERGDQDRRYVATRITEAGLKLLETTRTTSATRCASTPRRAAPRPPPCSTRWASRTSRPPRRWT